MEVELGHTQQLDAFGRLRVSNPVTLFESQLQYDLAPLLWESSLAGSASDTHDANSSSTLMAVTASGSDKAIRQTREYHRFEPGKSQLITMTAVPGAAVAGVDKRIGYFDALDGVFFEVLSTTSINWVHRTSTSGSAVNEKVAQAAWNLDTLDGTGGGSNPSGRTLDITKSQIFIFDMQWPCGRIRLGFEDAGEIFYCHEFVHANIETLPHMKTANLPLRFELDNTSGANTANLRAVAGAVISEGGASEELGYNFAATNGVTLLAVGQTRRPILSVRPAATFNSIANRTQIRPISWSVYSQDKECYFELVYGTTLTNGSFNAVHASSGTEFDVAGTALSGGITVAAFITDKKGSEVSLSHFIEFPMALNIAAGHPTSPFTDSYTIAATSLTAGDTDCSGTIEVHELR